MFQTMPLHSMAIRLLGEREKNNSNEKAWIASKSCTCRGARTRCAMKRPLLGGRYEVHHGVKIRDDALVEAATVSDRYIADRFLPDKVFLNESICLNTMKFYSVLCRRDLAD